MRWKALYIIIGLTFILWLIGTCFGGLIMKWSLENAMETVTGAQVDMSRVSLNLFNLGVHIGDLQIANPSNTWRNLIQVKDVRFRLEPEPLLYGKVIIEEIAIEELMVNSKRKTDGKLNRPLLPGPFGEAQARLHKSIAGIPVLKAGDMAGQFNVEALLKNYSFDLDLSAVDIESRLTVVEKRWATSEAELDKIKDILKQNEAKLETLKSGDFKNPLVIREKLKTVKDVRLSLNKIKQIVETSQNGFKEDLNGVRSAIDNLREVADGDYQKIIKMANVPNPKQMDITQALLGKDILDQSTVVLNLVGELQEMVPVEVVTPPKVKHVRGGQDVVFPSGKTYPRLLIRKIYVSGRDNEETKAEGFTAQATIKGVTSEPMVYGKPVTLTVLGTAPNRSRLKLDGRIDRTRPDYQDEFHMKLSGFSVPELSMPKNNRYLPSVIRVGSAEVSADLTLSRNDFLLNVTVDGYNLLGDYQGRPVTEDLVQEIVREALTEMDMISLNYRLRGIGNDLKMELNSNLDAVVREQIKAVIGRKLEEFVNFLWAKVEARLGEKQVELNAKLNKSQVDLVAKFLETQEKLDLQSKELDVYKKKLEEGLEKAKGKLKLPEFRL